MEKKRLAAQEEDVPFLLSLAPLLRQRANASDEVSRRGNGSDWRCRWWWCILTGGASEGSAGVGGSCNSEDDAPPMPNAPPRSPLLQGTMTRAVLAKAELEERVEEGRGLRGAADQHQLRRAALDQPRGLVEAHGDRLLGALSPGLGIRLCRCRCRSFFP